MSIALPLLTLALLFLTLLGLQERRSAAPAGVRAAFLEAAALAGGYLLLLSELLGLFRLLAGTWAAIGWGLALLATGWLGWKKGLIADGLRRLRSGWERPRGFDLAAGIGLGILLGLLFVVAVISPPNNNDSLQYHMSRVMHWAQDGSLEHYATGFEPQLFNPIWAETAILHARLLWGSDRLANLVQWGSLVGALIGVSALASLLGASRKGQWLAAAFAVSLPMGLLQATSTQNDLVTAFWLVSLLYFAFLSARRALFGEELVCLALALGLGMLTKGTFYPYAVPPMLFLIFQEFRKHRPGRVLGRGLLVGAVALALNLGYWGRDLATFGGPFGPPGRVSEAASFEPNLGAVAGSVTRNVFLNLATPDEGLNQGIVDWLKHAFRSIDPRMAGFTLTWGWNHEDLAGNPLHLLLILLALILLILVRRKVQAGLVVPYVLVALGMYVLLAAIVRAGAFDGRYQLPSFIAWAPFFGITVQALGKKWLPQAVVLLLMAAALPWALFNRTRPLIAMRDSTDPFTIPCLAGCTNGSVLNEPRSSTVFGVWRDLRDPYMQASSALQASSCRDVGLQLDSHDPEYLFWWLLDAPQSGIRLETLYTYPELQRYVDPAFRPCAILCTICGDRTRLHGLDLAGDFGGKVQLYLGDDYDPNP